MDSWQNFDFLKVKYFRSMQNFSWHYWNIWLSAAVKNTNPPFRYAQCLFHSYAVFLHAFITHNIVHTHLGYDLYEATKGTLECEFLFFHFWEEETEFEEGQSKTWVGVSKLMVCRTQRGEYYNNWFSVAHGRHLDGQQPASQRKQLRQNWKLQPNFNEYHHNIQHDTIASGFFSTIFRQFQLS